MLALASLQQKTLEPLASQIEKLTFVRDQLAAELADLTKVLHEARRQELSVAGNSNEQQLRSLYKEHVRVIAKQGSAELCWQCWNIVNEAQACQKCGFKLCLGVDCVLQRPPCSHCRRQLCNPFFSCFSGLVCSVCKQIRLCGDCKTEYCKQQPTRLELLVLDKKQSLLQCSTCGLVVCIACSPGKLRSCSTCSALRCTACPSCEHE